MADNLSVEEIKASWLTPSVTLDRVMVGLQLSGGLAVWSMMKRLRNGLLRAAGHDQKHLWRIIQKDEWTRLDDQFHLSAFWRSGDVTLTANAGLAATTRTDYFNVRFDPVGLNEWLPARTASTPLPAPSPASAPSPDSIVPASEPPAAEEPPANRPAVPEAHLRAWVAVYKKAYEGKLVDTEAFAIKSAQGMFPDKHVSRDRVRQAYGPRQRGRPSKPDDPAAN